MNHVNEILLKCSGLHVETKTGVSYNGEKYTYYRFFLTDKDIVVPDDVYLKIIATSTNGTIGKLIDIDVKTISNDKRKQVSIWDVTFLLHVDGRKKPVRINSSYTKLLENHNGTTKYVRNVKKHKKEPLKKPITKFHQEINVGDWVFGAGKKKLYVGRITRYSKTSVWITLSDDLKDRRAEIRIDNNKEIFKIENSEELTQQLTFARLKGWTGD